MVTQFVKYPTFSSVVFLYVAKCTFSPGQWTQVHWTYLLIFNQLIRMLSYWYIKENQLFFCHCPSISNTVLLLLCSFNVFIQTLLLFLYKFYYSSYKYLNVHVFLWPYHLWKRWILMRVKPMIPEALYTYLTCYISCYFHIMNKYDCHIAIIGHISLILHRHMDINMYVSKKTQMHHLFPVLLPYTCQR